MVASPGSDYFAATNYDGNILSARHDGESGHLATKICADSEQLDRETSQMSNLRSRVLSTP